MPSGGSRKFFVIAAAALGIAAVFLFFYSAPQHPQVSPDKARATEESVPAPAFAPAAPAPSHQAAGGIATAQSPEELAQYIRRYAQTGGDPAKLYGLLGSMRLSEQPWWRKAEEVSALLDLATDFSVPDQYRVVAMGVYLVAAPQAQLSANSDAIQQSASGGSDDMVSAVLQGMADRSVTPAALTRQVLSADNRGTGAKCYAWNAARRTQRNDPDLAKIAISAAQSGMTEASKVAFDYLATGSFAGQYTQDSDFRQVTDTLLRTTQSLPTNAGPMGLANGDAFIRALRGITPTTTTIDLLSSVLESAANPEMRLSAIEQLVSIHVAGESDLSRELHQVREEVATLFSDPVKQNRAKSRLNRIQAIERKETK
jgi:hypothetical protein